MSTQSYIIKRLLGPRNSRGGGDGNFSNVQYEIQFPSEEPESISPSESGISNRADIRNEIIAPSMRSLESEIDVASLPVFEKLSLPKKTAISQIRKIILRGNDATSTTSKIRSNAEMQQCALPGDYKVAVPLVKHTQTTFSRGVLCEKLLQRPKSYLTEDPYNREKVLDSPYNALHDPSTWNYFGNRSVQELLMKQGLLTSDGKVACSLAEYNAFRKYLNNTILAENFKETWSKITKLKDAEREQTRVLTIDERTHTAPIENLQRRTDHAKQVLENRQQEAMKRYEEKQQIKTHRIAKHKREIERKRIDLLVRGEVKERMRLMRIKRIKERQEQARLEKLQNIEAKEKAYMTRKFEDFNAAVARRGQEGMQWFEKRLECHDEKEIKEDILETALRSDLLRKAEIRQHKIELWRSRFNEHRSEDQQTQKPTKAEELRQKYSENWNKYVEKQQKNAEKIDALHESNFITFDTLQALVADLQRKIDETNQVISGNEDTCDDLYEEFSTKSVDST